MKALALALVAACGSKSPEPSTAETPPHGGPTLDTVSHDGPRMVPPEAFLRAYLEWFGQLGPREVFLKARGSNMFDNWADYLAALGLPDYKIDVPRATQSNTMMLATIGRLGEALCLRSAEHDFAARTPIDSRQIYAFDARRQPTIGDFQVGFDVLHRTFLGYPVALASSDRVGRYFELYQRVASRHAGAAGRLTAEQRAWGAVCAALVMHPEAGVY